MVYTNIPCAAEYFSFRPNLAENIAFEIDKIIDMKKLKEAINISQLDKFVENSENGLFSNVERGASK